MTWKLDVHIALVSGFLSRTSCMLGTSSYESVLSTKPSKNFSNWTIEAIEKGVKYVLKLNIPHPFLMFTSLFGAGKSLPGEFTHSLARMG